MTRFQRLIQICIVLNALCNVLNFHTYVGRLAGAGEQLVKGGMTLTVESITLPVALKLSDRDSSDFNEVF